MSPFLQTSLIVLGVLLLCVAGMAIGVIFGRKPIKHCGGAINDRGEREPCSLCGNRDRCPNKDKDAADDAEA